MDCENIGKLIYTLRKEKALTQTQLADLMNISDKAISKWERGQGCPDVSLLPELSQLLGVNIEGLLAGEIALNETPGGNMKKIKFYVCPQCNNLITATGDAGISCCGKKIAPLEAAKATEPHLLNLEKIEGEIYISSSHEMTKEHHWSFVAYVTGDRALLVKQYPEWDMQCRLPSSGHGRLYAYCTRHGLFYQNI